MTLEELEYETWSELHERIPPCVLKAILKSHELTVDMRLAMRLAMRGMNESFMVHNMQMENMSYDGEGPNYIEYDFRSIGDTRSFDDFWQYFRDVPDFILAESKISHEYTHTRHLNQVIPVPSNFPDVSFKVKVKKNPSDLHPRDFDLNELTFRL